MRAAFPNSLFLLVIAGSGLPGAAGCDEVALELDRPAPRAIRPVEPLRAEAPPAAGPAAPAPEPDEGYAAGFHQLVLHSEPAPGEAPPRLRYVRLARAAAGDVGPILSWLQVPSGPAGSRNRYCLVYPTRAEADAAARHALLLDVPAITQSGDAAIPADGVEAFRFGVGLLYGRPEGQAPDGQRARQAEAALDRAAREDRLEPSVRWAAGMIAGTLAAEFLYDYDAAERHLALADTQAQPGSMEQMCTWFARACNDLKKGQEARARSLLARLIAQFGSHRETETFLRATRILSDLNRKR